MKTFFKPVAILLAATLANSAMAVTYNFLTADYVDQEYWNDAPILPQSGSLDVTSNNTPVYVYENMGYNPGVETVSAIEFIVGYESASEVLDLGVMLDLEVIGAPDVMEWYGERNRGVYRYIFDGLELGSSFLSGVIGTGMIDYSLYDDSGIDREIGIYGVSLALNTSSDVVSSSTLPQNVPDSGATMGLLVAGLVCLVGFKRKLL